MSKLKKEIAHVEKEIEKDNDEINLNYAHFKQNLELKHYIYGGILGTFMFGFLLARAKNRVHFIRKVSRLTAKAVNLYNNVKMIL